MLRIKIIILQVQKVPQFNFTFKSIDLKAIDRKEIPEETIFIHSKLPEWNLKEKCWVNDNLIYLLGVKFIWSYVNGIKEKLLIDSKLPESGINFIPNGED